MFINMNLYLRSLYRLLVRILVQLFINRGVLSGMSSKNKKNIKFGICLIILFLVIVGVNAIYNNCNKENDINEILESKYYAYLRKLSCFCFFILKY